MGRVFLAEGTAYAKPGSESRYDMLENGVMFRD